MTFSVPTVALEELLTSYIGGLWGDDPGRSEVDVRVMRITELGSNGDVNLTTATTRSVTQKQLASRRLSLGDLVLEKSGGGPNTPVGRVAHIGELTEEYICSNFMLLMRLKSERVSSRYLHLFLTYLHITGQTIPLQSSSTNIRNISTPDYMKIQVPLPPIEEQKRIVEALDSQLEKLERVQEETAHAGLSIQRFSSSLLHAMFSGDMMQTELGIIDVKLSALSSVAEVQSGGTPKGLDRLTSESPTETHSVPFYKVGDMNRDPRYMDTSRSYLNPVDVSTLKLKVMPQGSVVFPKAGGAIATNKKRLVRVPGPVDLNCMAVIPSEMLLPSYLAWWFESFKLSDLSNGSILPQIGKTAVMQVELPCPSLEEQSSVVEYLEEKISRARQQAMELESLSKSVENLRRSILNRAFSGQSAKEN